jgi:hypothetical protein
MSLEVQSTTFADWLNSHYFYVKNGILQGSVGRAAINPERAFGGIVQARAWPPVHVSFNTFYLIANDGSPLSMSGENSWFAPGYSLRFAWGWMIQGDQTKTAIGASGGDRYQIHNQMRQELLFGMYAGFCEKVQYSVRPDGIGNPVLTSTSFVPKEMVWWKKPSFSDKYDTATGILTGSGMSEAYGFSGNLDNV